MPEHVTSELRFCIPFRSEGGGQEKGEGREGRGQRQKEGEKRRKMLLVVFIIHSFTRYISLHDCFQLYNYSLENLVLSFFFTVKFIGKTESQGAVYSQVVPQLNLRATPKPTRN